MIDFTAIHGQVATAFDVVGTAVSITFAAPTGYDPTTGTFSGTGSTTVVGKAVAVRPNAVRPDMDRYRDLGLVKANAITLLFWPTTYGEQPEADYTVTWGGNGYVVNAVDLVAPAGSALVMRVIVSR